VDRATTPRDPTPGRYVAASAIAGVVGLALASAALIAWPRRDATPTACCPGAGPAALDDSIESKLNVRARTLPNGLRYYVYANPSSGTRAQLRLVVNAGSVLEKDDEHGLAHVVEHMAIRGSRRFPPGTVERYFETLGLRRGEGVNATTSLDETVYRMVVPTDRPGALDTALAMLAGIAHEAVFDRADARREAAVIIEEWRSNRDLFQRVADARHSLIFAGTPYAARTVIGDTGVLRRVDARAMRRFYEAWYRPELMGVVAVGDFDDAEVEKLVIQHFGGIPRNSEQHQRPSPAIPVNAKGLRASVVADPEATSTWVGVWYPGPRIRYQRRSDYRAALIAALWRQVLSARLEDASLAPGSPFVSAGVEYRALARSVGADLVSALAVKDHVLAATEAVASEIERLARHGATQDEVDERALALLRQTRDGAESGEASTDLAAEFVDRFINDNVEIPRRVAYELTRDILPTIKAEDVTAFARTRSIASGAVVIAIVPTDAAVTSASSSELVARAGKVVSRTVAPPPREPDVRELLATSPAAGRVVSERSEPAVRVYEWTLSNGMRVILKPTAFTFDEIQLSAVAPGGASLASDADYPSAYLADAIIGETGVGRVPANRLDRWLESTSITMWPQVTNDAVSITGKTAPRDLESFFQLLHLYLTAPRSDTVAFRRYRDRVRSLFGDRQRDPDAVFNDTVASALAGGHARAIRNSGQLIERAKLSTALEFWRRRVSSTAGFTVVLTGDFTLDRVRPLVERYLASLPRGSREQPSSAGAGVVTGIIHRKLDSGIGGGARTAIGLTGQVPLTLEATDALSAVRDLLDHTLTARLRDQLGGTYSVDVELAIDVDPPTRYSLRIDFGGAPERIESLAAQALAELDRLRRHGPTEPEFLATRTARVRDYDGKIKDNDYWISELASHARYGWPLSKIAEHPRDAERLTLAQLRAACERYIPSGRYIRVTMRPRSGGAIAAR
jgi:zinc protease